MSTKTDEADEVCASCGIQGGDDIKLKKCGACQLVRYCSAVCQKEHRPQHKQACKKRAAELREELLFKQPEISSMGDCPICCLPLELETSKSKLHPCCSKLICDGCVFAHQMREVEESQEHKCPFCRTLCPKNQTESMNYVMKRIEANDSFAIFQMGVRHWQEQKYSSSFEFLTKAAELGEIEAHYYLGMLYKDGLGVKQDKKKEIFHLEKGAIGGDTGARYNLALYNLGATSEGGLGSVERAVKHFIINASLGHFMSMEWLKVYYKKGFVKKEDLATALRAHKVAVDAAKSPQREEAERHFKELRNQSSGT